MPAGPARTRAGDDPDLVPDPTFWGEPRRRLPRVPRPAVDGPFDVWRDRWEAWRSDARIGVIALVVVAVVAGLVWYRVGVSRGDGVPASRAVASSSGRRARDPASAARAAAGASRRGPKLVVHVAGAVARPGVVKLPAGSRVIDAVEAAGGGVPGADLDRLNLAAKLVDGERVLVSRIGDPTTPDQTATDGSGAAGGSAGGTTDPGGRLNLNTATEQQLEALPGIGPSLAAAIIAERQRRGGFRSVNELRDVHGIGEKRFADLRARVTV